MKSIYKILLLFACSCGVSCGGDDEPAMTALAVQGIRAEAFPGAIRLTWNPVENSDFLYTEVSYYDFGTQTTVSKQCSRYTGTLYIDGLLNRYGKYRFTFTAYDVNGTPGQPVYIERQCEKAESYYVVVAENLIPLAADQLATNAQEPSEGPLELLVDGNPDTFFQSFWDEWTYPELKPAGYHYLTFDLRKEVSAFKFQYWNRKKANGSLPKTVNIYGSPDGETWALLAQLDNLPGDLGSSYTSELFLPEEPISPCKIRGGERNRCLPALFFTRRDRILRGRAGIGRSRSRMTIIIEKATIKMKNLLKYILLLIYVALMPACGEDSGLDGVFANKPFALVTAADGGRTSISAVIDDGKRTIRLTFDKQRDVDAVELTFQLNPGYAMVSPKEPETTMDLTQPRTVTVSSGAGEVSYEISARNETPVLSASFLFRGKLIEGVIDHETRTVSFPVTTIYASEYPEELLGAVPLDITLSDGYRPTSEKVSYDLSTGESFSVYKGRNTYTYKLVADIARISVADHLADVA